MSIRKLIVACTAATLGICVMTLTARAIAQNAAPSPKQPNLTVERLQGRASLEKLMHFTPDEAKKFWPLYDQYEAEMEKIDARHLQELQNFGYANLSEKDAADKLDEVIAIQQARVDTEKRFIPKFRAALSQVQVARFFQIDSKLRAMLQCDIAKAVPLVK
jgi:Spy/CpxP family protein refolding chaperone